MYLQKYGNNRKRVLFLGMNPGPFGMVQTGIPFGEVKAVQDWLKIEAPIGRPVPEHPRRPVLGFRCPRSEVSGLRLWGLFARRFSQAEEFFRDHFVINYCPLAFLEASGCNRTPDKLPSAELEPVLAACDEHLRGIVRILAPEWLIGVGRFAEQRASLVLEGAVKIGRILHPSPSNPASNRDWASTANHELTRLGIWKQFVLR
jgi:single-strand selective monofunctional uracil DNA glycosylase